MMEQLRGRQFINNTLLALPAVLFLAVYCLHARQVSWQPWTLQQPNGGAHLIGFATDSQTAIVSSWQDDRDKNVDDRNWIQLITAYNHLCNLQMRQSLKSWKIPYFEAPDVLSPDGKTLAHRSFQDNDNYHSHIYLRNVTNARVQCHIITHGEAKTLMFAPDGHTFASASQHEIELWNPHTGGLKCTIRANPQLLSLAIAPDSKTIAAGCGGKVNLWNVSTGALIRAFACNSVKGGTAAGNLVFSPDNQILAAAISGVTTVALWNVQTGALLKLLPTTKSWIGALAFSHDEKLLAVSTGASNRHIVQLWKVQTGQCIRTLKCRPDSALALVFSPDDSTLAVESNDQTVQFWRLNENLRQSLLTQVLSIPVHRLPQACFQCVMRLPL
ncbi:MAG: hypothetical protein JO316_16015 [Abitibacteriaceae bacterium]|nr:hypothetical protein [Abditibacteriaceae bacterium]MBV9866862.1 hypothetical protein [Abditibacteriaceae bacterium]